MASKDAGKLANLDAHPKLQRMKTASIDLATADQVKGDAPYTPWDPRMEEESGMTFEPEPEPETEPAPEPEPDPDAPATPFTSMFVPGAADALAADLDGYLTANGIDWSGWDADALTQLGSELVKGEAVLGVDDGAVKRVVSVAKPVLFDGKRLLVRACGPDFSCGLCVNVVHLMPWPP